MKIAMLGHSGAGKTTYMASMYGAMAGGIGGFSVRAGTDAGHDRLAELARGVRTGRYPPGTAQPRSYELVLRQGGADVVDFVWQDYRGGALMDRSTDEQARQLVQDLATAHGIVVFADSLDLLTSATATPDIARIALLLTNALAAVTRPTPVVLALTKYDLVRGRHDLDDLLSPFGTLIRAIEASAHLRGMTAPLVCGPAPVNVPLPVLWCLRVGLMADAYLRAKEAEKLAVEAADYQRDATFRDLLSSIWWNVSTNGQIAERKLAERAEILARNRQLAATATDLGRLVASAGVHTY